MALHRHRQVVEGDGSEGDRGYAACGDRRVTETHNPGRRRECSVDPVLRDGHGMKCEIVERRCAPERILWRRLYRGGPVLHQQRTLAFTTGCWAVTAGFSRLTISRTTSAPLPSSRASLVHEAVTSRTAANNGIKYFLDLSIGVSPLPEFDDLRRDEDQQLAIFLGDAS